MAAALQNCIPLGSDFEQVARPPGPFQDVLDPYR
jgi:hypothetical protein